jgi:hypothetical protein
MVKKRVLLKQTLFLIAFFCLASISAFSGLGTGTITSPYQITNCTQLQEATDDWLANYTLMNNIDCSDTVNWNKYNCHEFDYDFDMCVSMSGCSYTNATFRCAGTTTAPYNVGFIPIGVQDSYVGTFNGKGYNITNLWQNRTFNRSTIYPLLDYDAETTGGLFAWVENSNIYNFSLLNVNITAKHFMGGVAGFIWTSNISNVNVTGNLNSTYIPSWVSYLGGIVGESSEGTITNCLANINLTGYDYIGGITGAISGDYTTILNSNVTGTIIGTLDNVGGIYGKSRFLNTLITVENSFFNGTIIVAQMGLNYPENYAFYTNYSWQGIVLKNYQNEVFCQYSRDNSTWYNFTACNNTSNYIPVEGLQTIYTRGVNGSIYNIANAINFSYTFEPVIYNITNCSELQRMSYDLQGDYLLMNDINCSDTKNWNGGEGFIPIGNTVGYVNPDYLTPTAFEGTFNGQGYKVSNLTQNRFRSRLPAGLFYRVSGNVSNVFMENVNISGYDRVGALAGSVTGNIDGCSSSGTVKGYAFVGGLAGQVNSITNSYSTAKVNGTYYVGGLVGGADKIENSYATGNVYGFFMNGIYPDITYDNLIGGLVGHLWDFGGSNIINSYATGNVFGSATSRYVGGFAGAISGGTLVGGLFNNNATNISSCYSTGNVSGQYYIGGFTGYLTDASILNSYAIGNVSGTSFVAGLTGISYGGNIKNSYSTGLITATGTKGGLIAYNLTSIHYNYGNNTPITTNSFWDTQKSGLSTSAGGTGKTTEQLRDISTFTNAGWDFSNLWQISSGVNNGYPYLSSLFVTLDYPDNSSSTSTTTIFNCSAISTVNNLTSSKLMIWYKGNGSLFYNDAKSVSGLTNTTTFDYNFTSSGTFLWNCEFSDGSSTIMGNSNYTIYSNLLSPAITLEKPQNNLYINTRPTFMNFTATDPDGLSSCELWGNFTGSWAKNYTWNSPTSGVTTFTTLNLEDNYYYWNVWCNDTLANGDFSPNNYTFGVDTIKPQNTIINISTTQGSQAFTFNSNANDSNSYTCKYTIYNLAMGIDGASSNVSFTCNTQVNAFVSSFATYILKIDVTDIAGNINSTNQTFVVFATSGGNQGGGGGGGVPVVTVGNWTMETELQGSSYQFTMIQASSRSKDLLFENLGTTSRIIKLTCEPVSGDANICDNIVFDETQFALPLQIGVKTAIGFTVTIPDGYEKGDYVANLVATDELGNKGIITLQTEVTSYASITGALTKLFSSTQSGIPYLVLFLLIAFITGVLANFIFFKPNKIPSALSILVGLFFGIIFLLLPI